MATARRVLWETVGIVILLAVAAVAWQWQGWKADQQAEEMSAAHLAQIATMHRSHSEQLTAQAEAETEAVARALAAGMAPAVRSRRVEALDQAKTSALGIERVVFVHVLQADGTVLTTSDDKLATSGSAGDDAAWALGATELQIRAAAVADRLEVAVPLTGQGGTEAVLWMGYDVSWLKAADAAAGGLAQ